MNQMTASIMTREDMPLILTCVAAGVVALAFLIAIYVPRSLKEKLKNQEKKAAKNKLKALRERAKKASP